MPQKKSGRYSLGDIQGDIERFTNTTPPASWKNPREINYDAIENKPPSLLSDPSGWWAALDDDQKQQVLDSVGELAGGTAGAVAGAGPIAAPLTAGVGAVAGKGAARLAGKVAGLKPKQGTAAEGVKDVATTFAAGAVGEAAGRGIPLIPRAVKSMAQRTLKRMVKPDPDVVRLAAQGGVPLTPGMASTNTLVKLTEMGLEKLPGGTTPIRKATMAAVEPWERNVRAVPNALHPTPITTPEAGEALQGALSANRAATKQHFAPRYTSLNKNAGSAPIDMTGFRGTAQEFVSNLPQNMEGYFPSAALRKLKQAAGMVDGQHIGPNQLIDGNAPIITFEEAQQLRTGLLEAERAMSTGDAAVQRRAIPALRDALDKSIDESLSTSTNPAHRQALSEWRRANSEYGAAAKNLYPAGRDGNATAGVIESAKLPENLPPQIANKPTAIEEAEIATTPVYGAPQNNAMNKYRRNRADDLLGRSETQNRFISDHRIINPRTLEKRIEDVPGNEGTRSTLGPVLRPIEDQVKLGKAITSPTQLTNASETARTSQLINIGTLGAGAVAGGVMGDGETMSEKAMDAVKGVGTVYLVPKLAAKAWTGPMARAITSPTSPLISGNAGGPLLGAAGRAIMEMEQLPSPKPRPIEQGDRKTGRFSLSDIQ
jgi:hypothetical protein